MASTFIDYPINSTISSVPEYVLTLEQVEELLLDLALVGPVSVVEILVANVYGLHCEIGEID